MSKFDVQNKDWSHDEKDASAIDRPVRLDIERMSAALEGPFAQIPAGLSADQIHAFLIAHSK